MTTLSPTQTGTFTGGSWSDGAMVLLSGSSDAGAYFTLQTAQSLDTGLGTTRSLYVDPDRWRTLTLTVTPNTTLNGTLTISARVDGANPPLDHVPALFATANPPVSGDRVTVYSADPGFTAGVPAALVLDMGTAAAGGPSTTLACASSWLHGANEGRLALALEWSGALVTLDAGASLNAEDERFLSGVERWHDRWARVDRCPKCGQITTRDQLVRDGYTEAMVCPRCWDPEDEVGRAHLGRERSDPFDRG